MQRYVSAIGIFLLSVFSPLTYGQSTVAASPTSPTSPASHASPASHSTSSEETALIAALQQRIDELLNENHALKTALSDEQITTLQLKSEQETREQKYDQLYPARIVLWFNRWSMTAWKEDNHWINNGVEEWITAFHTEASTYEYALVVLATLLLLPFLTAISQLKKKKQQLTVSATQGTTVPNVIPISDSAPATPATQTPATQLDLARAFIDMGEYHYAEDLLKIVLIKGDTQQKAEAKELMQSVTRYYQTHSPKR